MSLKTFYSNFCSHYFSLKKCFLAQLEKTKEESSLIRVQGVRFGRSLWRSLGAVSILSSFFPRVEQEVQGRGLPDHRLQGVPRART